MEAPLSRAPGPESEDNLLRPVPIPESIAVPEWVADDSSGLPRLAVAALACAAGGYGSSYLAEFWPAATIALFVGGPLCGLVTGMLLVRSGVLNPGMRMFLRWRRVSFDWKDRALQAEAALDQAAQDFTGEDDPATARRLMQERLVNLKKGRGRGRPRGSRTGMDHETWLEKAREIRKLRRQRITWDNMSVTTSMAILLATGCAA